MSAPPLKMRNIGPKSAAWLRQVGLRTPEDLVEAGPLEAFMRIKRAGFKPSLNLLYSLEGALRDCHWQDVPEDRRACSGTCPAPRSKGAQSGRRAASSPISPAVPP